VSFCLEAGYAPTRQQRDIQGGLGVQPLIFYRDAMLCISRQVVLELSDLLVALGPECTASYCGQMKVCEPRLLLVSL
jgi:hypothetical protein